MTDDDMREMLAAHCCDNEGRRLRDGSPTVHEFTSRVLAAMAAVRAAAIRALP